MNSRTDRFAVSMLAASPPRGMKRLWLLLPLLFAACTPSVSDTPKVETSTPVLASQPAPIQQVQLRRGVNMGNMLEAPNEGDWGLTVQEEYFDLIRQAGFDFVRLPVRWSAHASHQGQDDGDAFYTIDPAFFKRVDQVIDWALQRDLAVILDFHHYEELMADPNEEQFLNYWRQIAEHYQHHPPQLLFELLSEPSGEMDAALWNTYIQHAIPLVRETNPDRELLIGPVQWNSYQWLSTLDLPQDENLIATFHFYEPFRFTHQGADWVGEDTTPWLGTTWQGSDSEQAEIVRAFDHVAAWAERRSVRVLLGEFGAYSMADMESRLRWTSFVARQAEAHGFAWSYWEFASSFGIYNPEAAQWRDDLLKALISGN